MDTYDVFQARMCGVVENSVETSTVDDCAGIKLDVFIVRKLRGMYHVHVFSFLL